MAELTTHTIDAAGRPLGRVASEAASILIGKHSAEFVKNRVLDDAVVIENADKLAISEKKRAQKMYQTYTGYPGGQKEVSLQELLDKKGVEEALRKAVYGMLPGNKLRAERMKRLTINK